MQKELQNVVAVLAKEKRKQKEIWIKQDKLNKLYKAK